MGRKGRGWHREFSRHSLAARGIKTTTEVLREKRARREVPTNREIAELLSEGAEKILGMPGFISRNPKEREIRILMSTGIDHLGSRDYEGAYAAFASAQEEAEEAGRPDVAGMLEVFVSRAKFLQRYRRR